MNKKKTYITIKGYHENWQPEEIVEELVRAGACEWGEANEGIDQVRRGKKPLLSVVASTGEVWALGQRLAKHGAIVECGGLTHDMFSPEDPDFPLARGVIKIRHRALNFFEAIVISGDLPESFRIDHSRFARTSEMTPCCSQ